MRHSSDESTTPATFYIFSDGDEWDWFGAVNEINKIAPFCH